MFSWRHHPKPKADSPLGMIATYFAAFVDAANIEKRGLGRRMRADVDPLNGL